MSPTNNDGCDQGEIQSKSAAVAALPSSGKLLIPNGGGPDIPQRFSGIIKSVLNTFLRYCIPLALDSRSRLSVPARNC